MTIINRIMVLMAVLMLVSVASGTKVEKTTGPFEVSFELPVDTADVEVEDPYVEDTFSMYSLDASADEWYVRMVIAKYDNSRKIDTDAESRSIAASAGVEKSQVEERTIDGKSVLYASKEADGWNTTTANYWLDSDSGYGTKFVEITVASSESIDKVEGVLDTLKIK